MYRRVGMGNWLTDLLRVQLPPMSMRIDLPGGIAITPAGSSTGTSAPVNRAGVGGIPPWLIPVGIAAAAAALVINRMRR